MRNIEKYKNDIKDGITTIGKFSMLKTTEYHKTACFM